MYLFPNAMSRACRCWVAGCRSEGRGGWCRCNPISEPDLAEYIVNGIQQSSMLNKVLDVGGPDEGLTPKAQAELLFQVTNHSWALLIPMGVMQQACIASWTEPS